MHNSCTNISLGTKNKKQNACVGKATEAKLSHRGFQCGNCRLIPDTERFPLPETSRRHKRWRYFGESYNGLNRNNGAGRESSELGPPALTLAGLALWGLILVWSSAAAAEWRSVYPIPAFLSLRVNLGEQRSDPCTDLSYRNPRLQCSNPSNRTGQQLSVWQCVLVVSPSRTKSEHSSGLNSSSSFEPTSRKIMHDCLKSTIDRGASIEIYRVLTSRKF